MLLVIFFDCILYRIVFLKIRNKIFNDLTYDFKDFPGRIYTEKDEKKRNAAEYHFSWFTFMFNSGVILVLLIIWRITITMSLSALSFDELFILILGLVCFYLAHFQMKLVYEICTPKNSIKS